MCVCVCKWERESVCVFMCVCLLCCDAVTCCRVGRIWLFVVFSSDWKRWIGISNHPYRYFYIVLFDQLVIFNLKEVIQFISIRYKVDKRLGENNDKVNGLELDTPYNHLQKRWSLSGSILSLFYEQPLCQ